jgi:hypothetical protein
MTHHKTKAVELKEYIDIRINHTDQTNAQNTALLIAKIDSLGERMDDKIDMLTQNFNWKFYTTLAFCIPLFLKLFAPEITAFINS